MSIDSLYPIVHDLSEHENSCCCDVHFADDKRHLGPFKDYRKLDGRHQSSHPIPKSRSPLSSLIPARRSCIPKKELPPLLDQSDSGTVTSENEVFTASTLPPPKKSFNDFFVLTRLIFRCTNSEVWECVSRVSGDRFAVKIFTTSQWHSEVNLLKTVQGHEGVVRWQSVIEDDDSSLLIRKVYLVMELLGDNVLTRVIQDGVLQENQAKILARDLLRTLSYLQRRHGILHLNIHPSNVLFVTNMDSSVKICDFGRAAKLNKDGAVHIDFMRKYASAASLRDFGHSVSPYTAPELLTNGMANTSSDVWSIGALVFFSLTGRVHSTNDQCWPNCSRLAKQFIAQCMFPDPLVRWTPDEALSHAWLAETPGTGPSIFSSCMAWKEIWGRLSCSKAGHSVSSSGNESDHQPLHRRQSSLSSTTSSRALY